MTNIDQDAETSAARADQSDEAGELEGAADPPGADADADGVAQVYELLHQVIDPEVGVNIVDLGLIYGVRVADRVAHVRMTLTTPGCPLGSYMDDSIRRVLGRMTEVDDTDLDLVWDPPWTPEMMTDAAKQQLGWMR